ncbi:MAG: glycosyltransferase family 87 protein [Flavisolibacter sp.]
MKKILFGKVKVLKKEVHLLTIIWFAFALVAAVVQLLWHSLRNFMIFRGVFWHVLQQTNLYTEYPKEYLDTNHYGPAFSLFVAPFAILPVTIGVLLWALVNAWVLYFAIRKLPLPQKDQLIIVAIVAIEMMTAMHNLQFNIMLSGWMVLAFVLVEQRRDFWATLFIAAGFLVKLYGIAAICFFLFSKEKFLFAWSFVWWCTVLVLVPMLYSSPGFIIQCYHDWFESLVLKNIKNSDIAASGGMQDISVMGMLRRVTGVYISNLWIICPAVFLIMASFTRIKKNTSLKFRLRYLAILLITVVIFSTSAESSTYVIAVTGVGIWYVLDKEEHAKRSNYILGLVFLFTILSSTDFCPGYLKYHFIRPYSLKAFPALLVWLTLLIELVFKKDIKSKEILKPSETC